MSFQVLKTAKYSLKVCRGSVEVRNQKAAEKLELFFEQVKDEFTTKLVSKDKVKSEIRELFPCKKIKLGQAYEAEAIGHMVYLENKHNNIIGYDIRVPLGKEKGHELSISCFDILMHELSHTSTALFHPKELNRIQTTQRNTKIKDIILDFYNKELYPMKEYKKLDKRLNKILKNRTTKEKIDFLQLWRYRLDNEKIAFEMGDKYRDKILNLLPESLKNFYTKRIKPQNGKQYNFDEKIIILNNKLAEVLLNERKMHAEKLNRK